MTAPARWPLNYLTSHGPRADPVTGLTWFLLGLSVLVVLIFAVAVGVGVVLRRQPTPEHFTPSGVARGGSGLAWIYIGMPLTVVALAVALFWTMAVLARIDHPATRPRLTIEVTGRQWWWQVRYLGDAAHPGFETANEIHIPVGEPVLIQLRGGDVIHSFWVPALTGKTDTIPGRNNVTWMQADKPGPLPRSVHRVLRPPARQHGRLHPCGCARRFRAMAADAGEGRDHVGRRGARRSSCSTAASATAFRARRLTATRGRI